MQGKRTRKKRGTYVSESDSFQKKLSFGVNIFGHYAVIRLKLQLQLIIDNYSRSFIVSTIFCKMFYFLEHIF